MQVNILMSSLVEKLYKRVGLGQDFFEKSIYTLNLLKHPSYSKITPRNRKIIRDFSRLFHNLSFVGGTWNEANWLGVKLFKNPMDLFVYQEIIFEVKPDVIVETGTAYGGSALYLASILDLLNNGIVITVEVNSDVQKNYIKHKRIKYILGSSTDSEVVKQIKKNVRRGSKVLVILDSDHHRSHVFEELKIYSKLVTVGSYLIVEDTNLNGHPVRDNYGLGPYEAVRDFLKEHKEFRIDTSREKFLVTNNPSGYLKKIKP